MSNELIEKPIEYVTAAGDAVKLTMTMVKRYLVSGNANLVTDQELIYFINICKARKLNPFIKDCYLIKYDTSPAAIITSVDYFRKNARKAADCRGWKKGVVVTADRGNVKYSNGIVLDGEKVVGGWFRAQPEGWTEPFELEVNLSGYIKKKKDGRPTQFWEPEKQATMIAKVAEAQGLKTLWGEATSGMYTPEEIIEDIDMAQGTGGTYSRDTADEKADTAPEATADNQPDFTTLMGRAAVDPLMEKFLNASALHFSLSVDDIKKSACEDPKKFMSQFQSWVARQKAADLHPEVDDAPPSEFRSEWIHLRSPGYSTYVHKNLEKFKDCDPALASEARSKWINFYEVSWPLDKKTDAPQTPPEAPDQDFFNSKAQDSDPPQNETPQNNGSEGEDFNSLVQTDAWQEMSLLQAQHPKIYAAVTNGAMPKTKTAVLAIIDEIEKRVPDSGEGIPAD